MEKDIFEKELSKKLQSKAPHLTEEQTITQHMKYIEYNTDKNPDSLFIIPIEEMAELTQHLSKLIRKRENYDETGILEEIADVQICLDNLKILLDIDNEKLRYAMEVKFERNNKRIDKNEL